MSCSLCEVPYDPATDRYLEPGIRNAVIALQEAGIETLMSCEGGEGHADFEPTIRVCSIRPGYQFKALAAAIELGLPVKEVRVIHWYRNDELRGPIHELIFHERVREWKTKGSNQ